MTGTRSGEQPQSNVPKWMHGDFIPLNFNHFQFTCFATLTQCKEQLLFENAVILNGTKCHSSRWQWPDIAESESVKHFLQNDTDWNIAVSTSTQKGNDISAISFEETNLQKCSSKPSHLSLHFRQAAPAPISWPRVICGQSTGKNPSVNTNPHLKASYRP